ncbi:MAG: PilZ domain-containing protein [Acidobacteriota bacterium]
MPKRRRASPKGYLERRRWARISLAIPVFVRGINGQGKEFLEFCTLLNESAGGALLAIRRSLPLRSRVSLEIPLPPVAKQINFRRKIPFLKARVVRITFSNGWNLCGLQFARPLLLS